eukprot:Phypoly_transcript_13752.p1 GENE.Phypoly_transcript_13752~~Phypoly_transcript_13752.p1  ORF type:complete len:327 (+),score=35.71 Phypoly_transcript_13752:110-982(+)
MDHGAPGYLAPLSEYDTWLNGQMTMLDEALVAAKRIGILLIVDLHALPGGDLAGDTYALFKNVIYQDKLVSVWQTLATRYKGNDAVWCYDICNEPHANHPNTSVPDWNHLAQRVINAIRAIDTKVPIMIEPMQWADPRFLSQLTIMTGGNIIYSIHSYSPGNFTSQGTGSHPYPGPPYPGHDVGGKYWDATVLKQFLQVARDWQLQHNTWIHVGEFSAVRWAANAVGYLNDSINIFEEWGWDWTYHAYRECGCWSLELGSDINNPNPVPNTDRLQLIKSYFAKNKNPYGN